MTKLYLVWNEAKTECVGFVDEKHANYANSDAYWDHRTMEYNELADEFIAINTGSKCTITEIEV